MIKEALVRTPILVFILTFFALGYTIAHNKVVVVPLGADAGVSGYERVSSGSLVSISAGGLSGNLDVTCPGNKKVLGGGGFAQNVTIELISSFPVTDQIWRTRYRSINTSSGSVFILTYAICANTIN